ncbi:MAG: Phosphoribosylformylglycinamidine cyclo-ligase [Pseudomonadota bacterium]|jgi:phosphoribosylformylglycinamidine cyclo-ligase
MAVTYREAGVDIDRADSLISRIKPLARATRTDLVVDDVGGFAGLCGLPADIVDPVLVSGTDGVGTKLKVAFSTTRHDTIGQDLVAMCVNDIITCGARPLFFLDYFGCGKLEVGVAESVISGIADGCKLAGCALLGGETAELPGMYADGEYDLAGFAVGVASRSALLGAHRVQIGDELVAVASSGLHSNGYSLARRVLLGEMGLKLDQHVPDLGRTLGEELLTPTKIYARTVLELLKKCGDSIHALSHITGGGIVDNLPRVLGDGRIATITLNHQEPAVFNLIRRGGPVEEAEMRRTFNLGVGLVLAVAAGQSSTVCQALGELGEVAWPLGGVTSGDGPARVVIDE